MSATSEDELQDLKVKLSEYLAKRKEMGEEKPSGKREDGNAVGVFDYAELMKFGYSDVVDSIMDNGGRFAMYDLMGMAPPPLKPTQTEKVNVVFDKEGTTDSGRYKGLRMSQAIDDDTLGEALVEAQRKSQAGESLRSKIEEEDYKMPFADRPKNPNPQLPDWTPERLDEYAARQGKVKDWVRDQQEKRARGELMKDPYEAWNIEGSLQAYSMFSALFVAFAFGKATPELLSMLDMEDGIIALLQAPAFALGLASVGSAIVASVVLAPQKKRGSFVWALKGFFGGPIALVQLRGLDVLVTEREKEENSREG